MILSSRNNPQLRQLRLLITQKKAREKSGTFVLEGKRLVLDGLEAGFSLTQAYVSESFGRKEPDAVKRLEKEQVPIIFIGDEVAHWVSDTKNTQGLFAVSKIKDTKISPKIHENYIVLDNVQDPGNVGTILRTALALGIHGVFISSDSAELYSPKVVRSAMGGVIRLPIEVFQDLGEVIARIKSRGIPVYAAALDSNSVPISSSFFSLGSAIILGNEGSGVSPENLSLCDKKIVIPVEAQSLNVAVAGSIFMWEMKKR